MPRTTSPERSSGLSPCAGARSPASMPRCSRCLAAPLTAASANSLSAPVTPSSGRIPIISARATVSATRRRAWRSACISRPVSFSVAAEAFTNRLNSSKTGPGPWARTAGRTSPSESRQLVRNGLLPKIDSKSARPALSSAKANANAASSPFAPSRARSRQRSSPRDARAGSPGRGRFSGTGGGIRGLGNNGTRSTGPASGPPCV